MKTHTQPAWRKYRLCRSDPVWLDEHTDGQTGRECLYAVCIKYPDIWTKPDVNCCRCYSDHKYVALLLTEAASKLETNVDSIVHFSKCPDAIYISDKDLQ